MPDETKPSSLERSPGRVRRLAGDVVGTEQQTVDRARHQHFWFVDKTVSTGESITSRDMAMPALKRQQ
jgi:hypothetical protein